MKVYVLFFLFFVTIIPASLAQNQTRIDSLYSIMPSKNDTNRLEVLISLFIEYMDYDIQKTREIVDQYNEVAEEVDLLKYKATGRNLSGITYNMSSHFEESLLEFESAKNMYTEIGDDRMISLVLNNMANSYRSLGNLTESLACHLQSLEIKKANNVSEETIAPSYWNIGNTLGDIGNYIESNEYYDKAIEIYRNLDYQDDIMELEFLKVLNMDHIDSTLNLIPQIESYIQHCRNAKYYNSLAGALDHLGSVYSRRRDFNKAEIHFIEALELAENHGEESLPGLIKRHMASLYLKQGLYAKALPFAEASLESSKEFSTKKKQINDYKVLADIYEGLGKHDKALTNYKSYNSLNNEVLSQENINFINELEIKYQAKEKETEIQLLTKENEIDRTQKKGLMIALVLLGALVLALYFANKQRSKASQLHEEKIRSELAYKHKELLAYTTQLAHKNEVLEQLKSDLGQLQNNKEQQGDMKAIIRSIDFNLKDDANWDLFKQRFENVHEGFTQRMLKRHPELSSGDLRLIALLKMELNSREIASLLNISQEGIKKARYRLRKKMGLESSESLENRILTF